ncbi:Lrp/AsnC family transcriptional regulator [Candidatus Woesearchaeota archaeon]|nr:Lrp/AsnC family transcriptional regulator [Candidatus Woesearchaeota archaeon]
MIDRKGFIILSQLRKNARESLTKMSRKTNIPVSTIFERLNSDDNAIKKHTTIIDFNKLGYLTIVNVLLSVKRSNKEELQYYLMKNRNVNSLYKIANGYDFLFEGIFKDMYELESFMDDIDENFQIKSKQVLYLLKEIKREDFLSSPEFVECVG